MVRVRALRESEAKYKAHFDSIDQGSLIMDVVFDENERPIDVLYVAANPAATRMLGHDVTGRRLREFEPSAHAFWYPIIGEVARTGNSARVQRCADRDNRWYDCHLFRLGGATSRRIGCLFIDITDRIEAEAALCSSQAAQAFLLRLSDALRPLGEAGAIKATSAAALGRHLDLAAVGYAEVEPSGERVVSGEEYSDDRMANIHNWHGLFERGGQFADRIRSGEDVYVQDYATHDVGPQGRADMAMQSQVRAVAALPLMKDGRMVAYLYAIDTEPRKWSHGERSVLREVAERTWAAVELRQSQMRLEQERARLQAIIDTIPVGLLILEAGGNGAVTNDEAKRIWAGTVAPERTSNLAASIAYWPKTGERLRAEEWPGAQALLYGRKTKGVIVDIDRLDGTKGTIAFSGAPIQGGDGQTSGAVVAMHDITELREAQARLEEADRRKNHFLAVLSHELRNPLTPVKNSLYVLSRVAPRSEQARRAKEVIERQINQLSHLVDDLLDITRISRAKIQLYPRRLELNELVRRTLEDHSSLFEASGIEVDVTAAPEPIFIHADWNRIAQVLSNLVQNAAKFTPAGGRVAVAVSNDPFASQAVVRVSDTGAGITKDILPHLFEPFMQADATLDRSKGGLGLGLALVKGLVEQHGGTVEARSDGLERGAEFIVRLPLDIREQTEVEPQSTNAVTHVRRRVLVIEDNIDAADSLKQVLELGGHEVAVAYNGIDGIAKARDCEPDIVLCDIGLPGMDGYEVARAFRADEALRRTHLVALSGHALPEDLERASAAGFERHLAKPPSVEKLDHVLASVPHNAV